MYICTETVYDSTIFYASILLLLQVSDSEMTYIVSRGALNSTHSLTHSAASVLLTYLVNCWIINRSTSLNSQLPARACVRASVDEITWSSAVRRLVDAKQSITVPRWHSKVTTHHRLGSRVKVVHKNHRWQQITQHCCCTYHSSYDGREQSTSVASHSSRTIHTAACLLMTKQCRNVRQQL